MKRAQNDGKKKGDAKPKGPKTLESVESYLLKVESQQVHKFIETRKQAVEREIMELRKKLELDSQRGVGGEGEGGVGGEGGGEGGGEEGEGEGGGGATQIGILSSVSAAAALSLSASV